MKNKIIILLLLCACKQVIFAQWVSPVAVNDTFYVYAGDSTSLFVLANDYSPNGSSLIIPIQAGVISCNHGVGYNGGYYISYSPFPDFSGIDTLRYIVRTYGAPFQYCDTGYAFIHVNNQNILQNSKVKAFISPKNEHFNESRAAKSCFEVTVDGRKVNTLFSHSIGVSGISQTDGSIKASFSDNSKIDFSPGPISTVYDAAYQQKWKRTWKIKRTEIINHRQHYQDAGYTMPASISEWPGNGNVNLGQSQIIAPFVDANNNGIYEPMSGDYPLVAGDEAVFFVSNDVHTQQNASGGLPMNIELQGYAFIFYGPANSCWEKSVFFHTQIINKSSVPLKDVLLNCFTDMDIAEADNDLLGCNVNKGYFYTYDNVLPGDTIFNPVQACIFLGGPLLKADGIDNPYYSDCNQFNGFANEEDSVNAYSINGFNFGDGINDNERMGLNYFIAHSYLGNKNFKNESAINNVGKDTIHYYYAQNKDVLYDSNMNLIVKPKRYRTPCDTALNPPTPYCRYWYPGLTDECNWGVMNKPYNSEKNWTMQNCGIPPYDMKCSGTTGPFDLAPGDTVSFDYVFTFVPFVNSLDSTLTLLNLIADTLRNQYTQLYTSLPDNYNINTTHSAPFSTLSLFPNPAEDFISVKPYNAIDFSDGDYIISNTIGKIVQNGKISGNNRINVQLLSKGYYFVKVISDNKVWIGKFAKQ